MLPSAQYYAMTQGDSRVPVAVFLHRSTERRPPDDVTTDASAARSPAPTAPPWVPRSCALQAVRVPCSSSSEEPRGLYDRRPAPTGQDMPQSVSVARWLSRLVYSKHF